MLRFALSIIIPMANVKSEDCSITIDDIKHTHCAVTMDDMTTTPTPQITTKSKQTNKIVCWLVAYRPSKHASVSQGRICSNNLTCCHTKTAVADQTFHLTQSQYTETRPASPSTDPVTPGAWQGSHRSADFKVTGMTRSKRDSNPGSSVLEADALITRLMRRYKQTPPPPKKKKAV